MSEQQQPQQVADDWEQSAETGNLPQQTSKLSLNANAPSFQFSAAAPRFTPRQTEGATELQAKPAAPSVTASASAPSVASATAVPAAESKVAKKALAEPAKPAVSASATTSAAASPAVTKDTKRRDANAVQREQESVDREVVDEMYGKEHVNIVFIGHVDAGKSTLGGNLLVLTGMVDKRTLEKYQKDAKDNGTESWYLSWALDSTKEERTEGKTVEVGRAYFETDKRRYSILDAPGHKGYVSNMISGAAQADVGVLVISARKGEYETGFERGGQTREHALLARTQGVNRLIVAINKMDDPTVEWSEERFQECTTKLAQFLKREAGYNPKTDLFFIPVSAYTGANLKERLDPKICPWWSGPSFLEYLDGMETLERKINAPLMMPVSAKFKDLGIIIEGKIESGHIKKRGKVILMPEKREIEVLAIYNETDDEVDLAVCGEQVRIKVKGIEEDDVMPGFVLSSISDPVHCVSTFEAQIALIDLQSLLTAGFSCVMYVHTAVQEVRVAALLHKLDRRNRKSKQAPKFATKGMKIVARLEAPKPICLERFTDYAQLGRFTLRDQNLTIGIGKVVKLLH